MTKNHKELIALIGKEAADTMIEAFIASALTDLTLKHAQECAALRDELYDIISSFQNTSRERLRIKQLVRRIKRL